MALVECVPNISEGRDGAKIAAVVDAVRAVKGAAVLHVDSGYDANRTVITFAAAPEAALEAGFALIERASEVIDMREQKGAHPRIGATDVFPFVPLEGATMSQCVDLANELGRLVAEELGIPVFLYEAAASQRERRDLSRIRGGEYEGLESKLTDPAWKPDFGSAKFNARSGATVIGARQFLLAYNVNLDTLDLALAREIAARIREKPESTFASRTHALKDCKAIGWLMPKYSCAQVSMNLTNFPVTGMFAAFNACAEIAREYGCALRGSELVGLVPRAALLAAGREIAAADRTRQPLSESAMIELACCYLGLSQFNAFKPQERIIEEVLLTSSPDLSV